MGEHLSSFYLRLTEVLVYMQAAHGDGIIQWAASAVSAPSAMVMYEQTTLWRHLDFIPLGLAFKTMCHVPLLLLSITYLTLRVLYVLYIVIR